MRRRLPITAATADIIADLAADTALRLRTAPAIDRWLFPVPAAARPAVPRPHHTRCVRRAFKAWASQDRVIDSELLGPDGHARAVRPLR